MILVNKCYEIVTEESAEHGEAESAGFEFEDQPFTFRELCDEMADYSEPSDSPCASRSWLSSEADRDICTGDETRYTLHYGHTNKSRKAKYWEKALRVNGFMKGKK